MTKSNARIAWIDIARGIAILLVLCGHSMRDPMREAYAVITRLPGERAPKRGLARYITGISSHERSRVTSTLSLT